ncbi:30S ribosomal protein S6e [[Eubacterium] cellulosolvens]
MVEFKAIIADPKAGKTYQTVVSGHHANSLIGKKIGDEFDGIFVSLPGFKLILTGGSDKNGFPMRRDIHGMKRSKILVSKGLGYKPDKPGKRKRKTFCGDTISPDIIQVNMKITSHGSKSIGDLLKQEGKKKEGE